MKLLVVLSRVPYPLDKGDKLRAYYQLKELSKTHEVYLFCLSDKPIQQQDIEHLKSFCVDVKAVKLKKWGVYLNVFLGLFSSLPLQVWYFYQRSAHRKLKQYLDKITPDHIYCQLVRAAEYVKHEHNIPKTLDYMDAFSKGVERRIVAAGMLRPLFKMEYQRLLKYENLIFEYFEHKTIISEQDREFIHHPQRHEISIVRNGINTDFFAAQPSKKNYDLVFVGNMSYAPNVDGAIFLAKKIVPALLPQFPNLKVLIAGASPHRNVKELAGDHVDISGWMDDIRDAYNQAKIFIAPLNIGTGLQNKLLEAMSMEVPCVTSQLANNALKAIPEEAILIGDGVTDYTEKITRLLNDESLRKRIASVGKEYVREHFGWEESTNTLRELVEKKHEG